LIKTKALTDNKAFLGSKGWANSVLRLCIQELKNSNRVLSARQLEVFYFLDELKRYGFVWQTRVLRYQIHLAMKKGTFTAEHSEADSLLKREEAS
jgi:hypothetical protein